MIMRLIIKNNSQVSTRAGQIHYFLSQQILRNLSEVSYLIETIEGPPQFDISALISIDVGWTLYLIFWVRFPKHISLSYTLSQ